ncbi:MAG: putative permease YicO [Alphaproteobacteria bacterium ADurb.Bin438]|nr:MAG: putative permease YicO [Alphaproteobacteria bacterium ADurb.Bin438]
MSATILVSVISCLIIAIFGNLPISFAPGMGFNAFFAYTICKTLGYSWQFALTLQVFQGVILLLLIYFDLWKYFVNAIPDCIKKSLSVGVGFFIAFIGLSNAEIVVSGDGVPLMLGDVSSIKSLLVCVGFVAILALMHFKFKGAILIGIFLVTILGIPFKFTEIPEGFSLFSYPSSLLPLTFKFDFSFLNSLKGIFDFLFLLITMVLISIFDIMGSFMAVVKKLCLKDENKGLKCSLYANSFGLLSGGLFGSSMTTIYLESASGISEGGKTGLTSLVVSLLFILSLFLSPLFLIIPTIAISPVLIIIGIFMMSEIKEIDFKDYQEAFPAFLSIIMMPLAFNIADGIIFGLLSYVLIKIATLNYKQIPIMTYVVGILFVFSIVLK